MKHGLASLRTALLPALLAALTFAMLSTGEARAFSGTQLWSVNAGSSGSQSSEAVAVDAAGNVYVAGLFENTIDFGGDALVSDGGSDIFVVKFDEFGNYLWSTSYGGGITSLVVRDLAVDSGGNPLLTGAFQGAVDFGGGALTSSGNPDIFVVKLDTGGGHLWSQRFGDGGHQEAFSIAVDGTDNVVLVGGFSGLVDFGGGILAAPPFDIDVFMAKFTSAGAHLWSASYGGTATQLALGVAVAPAGDVLLTGQFEVSVNFGGGPLADADGADDLHGDIFLARFDAAGTHVWSERFGDASNQEATAIALDTAGDIVVTGGFAGAVDFGGGPLTVAADANDIFLAKFEPDGDHLWSKRFFANVGYGHDVTADASNNVLLTGYYAIGQANFGGGAFPQVLNTDAFLAKFDPAGNHTWSKRFLGYEDSDLGNGVTTGPGNHVYLAGSFASEAFFGKFDGAAPTDGDGDGCTDAEELGHTTILGGNRDPLSPWDFYDVDGTKKIDSIDVGRVRSKFNQNYPPYDRSPGVHPAAPGPPDGIVDSIDIGLVRASFLHSCQALPN